MAGMSSSYEDLIPTVHLRDPQTGEILAIVPESDAEGWKLRLEQRKARMGFQAPKWPDKPLERSDRVGNEVFGPESQPAKPKRARGPWDPGWTNSLKP
jgi:hypothetical protein